MHLVQLEAQFAVESEGWRVVFICGKHHSVHANALRIGHHALEQGRAQPLVAMRRSNVELVQVHNQQGAVHVHTAKRQSYCLASHWCIRKAGSTSGDWPVPVCSIAHQALALLTLGSGLLGRNKDVPHRFGLVGFLLLLLERILSLPPLLWGQLLLAELVRQCVLHRQRQRLLL